MKKLFIAEKPSVATEFANALDIKVKRGNGYIEDASEKLYFFVDENGVYKKELDTNAPDLSKYEIIE